MEADTKFEEQNTTRRQRLPISTAPFSLSQLKKAVPPHCFKRSLLRSFSYVLYDLTLVSLFYRIATSYFHLIPHPLSYIYSMASLLDPPGLHPNRRVGHRPRVWPPRLQ